MPGLIQRSRSLIPACDVNFEKFLQVVEATADLGFVGAYKIGASLALEISLKTLVAEARKRTSKPLIYDHQKAATDIPDTADGFMRVLQEAGIDAVILFPLAGVPTQTAWTNKAHEFGLRPLIGGYMTHPGFLASDGGYVNDAAVESIYSNASAQRVVDFVVPGNKPDAIGKIRAWLSAKGVSRPALYAPGFITQGGDLSAAARVAGDCWHAIIGRALYEAEDVRAQAQELGKNL